MNNFITAICTIFADIRYFELCLAEHLRAETPSSKPQDIVPTASATNDSFSPITTKEVVGLLRKSLGNTCAHDQVPSRLIKLLIQWHRSSRATFQQVAVSRCLPGFI